MKVTMEKNYRTWYTLEDIDKAKEVIRCEKGDSNRPEDWAVYAVQEYLKGTADSLEKVITATATTARNRRVWNAYGEETGNMDIWIEGLAKTYQGYIEIGAYLTDIWQTGSDYDYRNHIYARYFKESR